MLRSAILMILLCRGLWASAETVYTVDCNGDFRDIRTRFNSKANMSAGTNLWMKSFRCQTAAFARMLFRRRVMKYWITPRRNM